MADLTDNEYRASVGKVLILPYPCVGFTTGGAQEFYIGSPVMIDVTLVDGYVTPYDSTVTATTSDIFIGLATNRVSITSTDTADGSKYVKVAVDGFWQFDIALSLNDVGKDVYMSDSNTLTLTTTNNLKIGRMFQYASADHVKVIIEGYAVNS